LRLILRRGTLFGPNVKPMRREDGPASGLEYRHGLLNIQYRPDQAQLDVWFERRVLSVERFRRETQVLRYVPGHWELHLIAAAKGQRALVERARPRKRDHT
jgi:hypothetical protein